MSQSTKSIKQELELVVSHIRIIEEYYAFAENTSNLRKNQLNILANKYG